MNNGDVIKETGEKQDNTLKNQQYKSIKFFTVFKLVMSIIYFIPSFLIFGLGLMANLFLLIIGAGGSKVQDTSSFMSAMGYIQFFSIIPTIFTIVVFILAIISCVKFFKNNYNKTMDLILSILFVIVNICYIIILFSLSQIFLSILLIIVTILLLVNVTTILKYNK